LAVLRWPLSVLNRLKISRKPIPARSAAESHFIIHQTSFSVIRYPFSFGCEAAVSNSSLIILKAPALLFSTKIALT